MVDKFDYYELDGRSLFKSILDLCGITDLHPSKVKYDSIDYYYSNPPKLEVVGAEIKVRGKECHYYPTLIMEVGKFNAIATRIKSKELDKAFYVSFIGNDTVYIFNLRDIAKACKDGKIEITSKYLPKTTAENSEMILKRVLLLPKEIGTKLIRVRDKWINPNKTN